MGIRRGVISFIFILFLTVQVYSKPSQDQYKQQAEAETDPVHNKNSEHKTSSLHKVQLTSTGLHSVSLLPKQNNLNRGPKVAELQTGCADGSVQNDGQQTKKDKRETSSNLIRSDFKNVVHFLKIRNKRESEAEDLNKNLEVVEKIEPEVKSRNKRNYFSWYPFPGFGSPNTGYGLPNTGFYSSPVPSTPFQYPGSVTGFSHTLSHSHYNLPSTPSYQVVIPVFGGQIPIFWPQKPIYYNPGYPSHNRPRPERPVSQTNNTDVPMTTGSRFGDPNGNLDDHPSWGVVDSEEDIFGGGSSAITTRRPSVARPTKPPTPPLFHRPSLGEEGEGNIPLDFNNVFEAERITTTTRRPMRVTTRRPSNIRPIPQRPQTSRTTTVAPERQLPRCTWAIITCCNPSNDQQVSSECFENAGCGGSFWGQSPCSKEATLEALEAAQRFYESQ